MFFKCCQNGVRTSAIEVEGGVKVEVDAEVDVEGGVEVEDDAEVD